MCGAIGLVYDCHKWGSLGPIARSDSYKQNVNWFGNFFGIECMTVNTTDLEYHSHFVLLSEI